MLRRFNQESEHLYAPLIEKYKDQEQSIPALSLSSSRSLLLAMPQGSKQKYAMAKLSLDKVIGSHRVISEKEAIASIACNKALKNKSCPRELEFVDEEFSFSANASLLQGQLEAGFIARKMPKEFFDDQQNYLLPMFSLHGTKNQDLLFALVKKSGLNPCDFIEQKILAPLAKLFAELLFKHKVSLELHPQNSLLKVNRDTGDISFVFRDMGGVSCCLSPEEREKLPSTLQDPKYFFSASFKEDAGKVLEQMLVSRLAFNFTKQILKSGYQKGAFGEWKSAMNNLGYLPNWHIESDNPDAHQRRLQKDIYSRYGYFEKRFGEFFLEQMEKISAFSEGKPSRQDYLDYLKPKNDPHTPCYELDVFKALLEAHLQD